MIDITVNLGGRGSLQGQGSEVPCQSRYEGHEEDVPKVGAIRHALTESLGKHGVTSFYDLLNTTQRGHVIVID